MSEYFNIYKDVWSFHKKFNHIAENNLDRWEEFSAEMDMIAKKYNNNKLCKDLLIAAAGEIFRTSREREKNEKGN